MTQQTQVVEKREHHAVRASHAKSTGVVLGELRVAPALPPHLAQGLFAKVHTYKVAIRFAQGPGETLGDRVSTHRGMSVKVFDVTGEKISGHTEETQDLNLLLEAKEVLANQFRSLANDILEEKSKRFTEQNQTNLGALLDPLKTKIAEFWTNIEDNYINEGKDRSALGEQVRQLMTLNQNLSEDAQNLGVPRIQWTRFRRFR